MSLSLISSIFLSLLSLHLPHPNPTNHPPSLTLCLLINGHSKSVWFADQIPLLFFFLILSLLLPFHSPALHRSVPLAAIMRSILSFVPAPMVHLASDIGTTGTGNRQEFLKRGGDLVG